MLTRLAFCSERLGDLPIADITPELVDDQMAGSAHRQSLTRQSMRPRGWQAGHPRRAACWRGFEAAG